MTGFACPAPDSGTDRILLGHGSGGQLMTELLTGVIIAELGGGEPLEDAAVVDVGGRGIVLTTDGFVVTPLFFPGGDIGSLAVNGTINDLAMRGAVPVALSLAYILEEGFPVTELRRITRSAATAAKAAGVRIVTGDTKVVGRGAADGLYVTTTGIGLRTGEELPSAAGGRAGDVVILSGPIGLHGTAILSAREGLGFESEISSDSRPLHRLVTVMIDAGGTDVHSLRDPTRGGLSSALNELADASGVAIEISEETVPVPGHVAAACALLGLDPLHVANEGCLVALVAPSSVPEVLRAMRSVPEGTGAVVIGEVTDGPPGRVVARTLIGSSRVVDVLVGEQLPRIC
ncbi:hydrogenase expression/formation protein HypE [Amycolatopsis azurea]|uniref:hydrogenase expression/formation protein HypE n=1 Tax=Amycolatopsis azurea TaxID=36819 RepID=UPI00382877C1